MITSNIDIGARWTKIADADEYFYASVSPHFASAMEFAVTPADYEPNVRGHLVTAGDSITRDVIGHGHAWVRSFQNAVLILTSPTADYRLVANIMAKYADANPLPFDNGDMSTLFQDGAGLVPVTAIGQPVGLQLPKGVTNAFGENILQNGDFEDATGWNLGAGWSIADGRLKRVANASTGVASQVGVSLEAGKPYLVSLDYYNATSGIARVTVGLVGDTETTVTVVPPDTVDGVGSFSVALTAPANASIVRITAGTTVTSCEVDNFRVREITTPVRHQPTPDRRPTWQFEDGKYFLQYDGTNDTLQLPPRALAQNLSIFSAIRSTSTATGAAYATSPVAYPGLLRLSCPNVTDATAALLFSGSTYSWAGYTAGQGKWANAVGRDTVFSHRTNWKTLGISRCNADERRSPASTEDALPEGTVKTIYFGSYGSTSHAKMREYGAIVVDAFLTDEETLVIEQYLALKSGAQL